METAGVAVAEGYLKDVLFFNNSARNIGGSMSIAGIEASLSLVANVVFDSNIARGGGALIIGTSRFVNVTGATFRNNRYILECIAHSDY